VGQGDRKIAELCGPRPDACTARCPRQAHCTVCANVTPAASPRAPEMRAPQGAPCFARACERRRAACSRASNREPRKEPASARARERRRRLRERATANEHVRTSWSKAPTRSARSSRAQAIGEVDTPSPCTGSRASRDARPRSRRRRRGGTINASEPTPQGGGPKATIDAASEQRAKSGTARCTKVARACELERTRESANSPTGRSTTYASPPAPRGARQRGPRCAAQKARSPEHRTIDASASAARRAASVRRVGQ
jgi:hypothetical protein